MAPSFPKILLKVNKLNNDLPLPSTTTPKPSGTANVGSENTYAKGDHIHPKDVSVTTATISTSWTGSSVPYTQTITVSGVTSTNVVGITVSPTATEAQVKAYQNLNWTGGTQETNKITLRAWGDKNTIAIPIVVTIWG